MATSNQTRLLTTNEFAAALGFKPQTIRAWVFFGKIPFVKLGRSVRFEPSTVEQCIARGRKGHF
jgi:excisionase family DNA binding protein